MLTKHCSTKRADDQSVRERGKFPVQRAGGGGLVQVQWFKKCAETVSGRKPWVRAVALALLAGSSTLPLTVYAAEECVIDLNNNTHNCEGIPAITFVSSPFGNQAVIKISFDPTVYQHNKAVFEVTYGGQPTGWTVDICDSKSCNGYGGDAGDTSNAAEVEINGTAFNVYSNTLEGYETQTTDGGLVLLNKPDVVTQGSTVSLEVSNEHVGWNFPTDKSELNSKYLFSLSGQAIPLDYDVYAAFNRVIESTRRGGSGASSVKVVLLKPDEQPSSTSTGNTSEPPAATLPPLILPTQDLGSGGLKQSFNNQTNRIRFLAPTGTSQGIIQGTTVRGFALRQPPGLSASATPEQAARHFLANSGLSNSFGLSATATELTTISEKKLDRERSAVRFQQTHQGIPVLGGEVIVHMDAVKNVMAVVGKVSPNLDTQNLSTTPSITATQAGEIALASVAKHYKVDASKLAVSSPVLWFYNPTILGVPGLKLNKLIWRVEVTPISEPLPIREVLLIDAQLGAVAFSYSNIQNLLDRKVYDNKNSTDDLSLPSDQGGTTRVPARIEDSVDTGILDVDYAYKYAGYTYDFYQEKHSLDIAKLIGLDDDKPADDIKSLISTVRYSNDGVCPNAYWSGKQMVYCDKFASAIDIVGHEMTHGVTEKTSGLFYFYQSGAINESFSDLWGEFIDQNNAKGTDTPDKKWLMGEDLPGGADRSMKDPTIFGHPDKMTSPYYKCDQSHLPTDLGYADDPWSDAGGVHFNSGVNNKAVYLMTDGNGTTITGLGYEKVAKLYYEVQTSLLTSASDYADLYDALLQACINLQLQYSAEDCKQVKTALDAVEMNKQPTACPAPEVALCDTPGEVPVDIFFDDLEKGKANWQISNTSTFNSWFIPQTTSTIGFAEPYATSGKGNIWGFDQGSIKDGSGNVTLNLGWFSNTNVSTNNIAIPSTTTGNVFLHFKHAYGFESDKDGNYHDGGVLEYSINGGTWTDANSLTTVNFYNGKLGNYDQPALPGQPSLAGKDAFVADSRGYISSRVSLSSLALPGKNIRFRFRMGTDEQIFDYGWFIDDVRVYTCKTPEVAACTGADVVTWQNGSIPDGTKAMKILSSSPVSITGGSTPIKVKSLCNEGTLQVTSGNLWLQTTDTATGVIYNKGSNATIKGTAAGSSIKLEAGNLFLNEGKVQAGTGQAGTLQNNTLQGGNGGSVEITANTIDQKSTGSIVAGNGGDANGDNQYPGTYAFGGKGGKATLFARKQLNAGTETVKAGMGGKATVYCPWSQNLSTWGNTCVTNDQYKYLVATATGGKGGDLSLLSPATNIAETQLSGGSIAVEPSSIIAGADTRIEAQEDIIIFGGDDWVLDLRNLSEGAITTPGNITLAVGNGSSIDLRGISGKAFNAGGQFKVLSDNVMLDAGVTLENIATATGGIVTGP
ncbi:MAG: hypothetical protein BWK78_05880, partial [Thiotrichaceae bacterium IS1]